MADLPVFDEVASDVYRLARGNRLLRYVEERGIIRRLPDGSYETVPDAPQIHLPRHLQPEPEDFDAVDGDV